MSPNLTREQFWRIANDDRLAAEYRLGDGLNWVASASLRQLQAIFLEYRVFTVNYAEDLALLVVRTPRSPLKTLMGALVHEELGSGDPEKSHIEMLDRFVVSLGVEDLSRPTHPGNLSILQEMRDLIWKEAPMYGIGLRGMGGECVCQVYLMELHRQLTKNPYLQAHRSDVDWEFWDVHAGEPDVEHNRLVKEGVDAYLEAHPESMADLVAGFTRSKEMLLEFFENIYAAARSVQTH